MRRPTLGKSRIVAGLRSRGYSLEEALAIYQALEEIFREAEAQGLHLKVFGLGTLRQVERRPKRLRHVRTGEMVEAPGGRTLRFHPSRKPSPLKK